MARAYSIDLRQRVVDKRKNGKSVSDIVTELEVSKTFVYDTLELQRETGGLEPRYGKPGPSPILDELALERIRTLVIQTPDISLEDIKENLELNVSIATICNAINHTLNLRYKKNSSRK